VGVDLIAEQCVQTSDNLNCDPAWMGGVPEYRYRLDEISDCFCCLRISSIHAPGQSVLQMDELLFIARQYCRVERDNIADRRFAIQLTCHLLSLFVQDTRARTEHRGVIVSLCYRVNEPVNLAIKLAETQFKVSPS
jgi:hypothetical protein